MRLKRKKIKTEEIIEDLEIYFNGEKLDCHGSLKIEAFYDDQQRRYKRILNINTE